MAQQGAALQNYNNELVKCERRALKAAGRGPADPLGRLRGHAALQPAPLSCRSGSEAHESPPTALSSHPPLGIEELCQKREELCRQIQQEEDEKQRLQNEVRQLTEKLARVNENLARKIASRNEFDRTIAETEAAYLKILESSQTLLSVLKREAGNLTKATASDQKSSGGKDS
ncbi:Sjoegren syndrome nuclear autoantigen 1 isoform X1 [Mus pahari]|uniref:Sjoegren syndrome nuclear autoantigen 1 isoform X1 n=1 Tax=Mus pahari TaxID=10093 RepID=UPI000A304CB2|nr:Sjoegren syndrome nuclear autoantigen 1 isoform X1 [Mus pahari]